jgi:deoxyribodipyrimidine photo-lyase
MQIPQHLAQRTHSFPCKDSDRSGPVIYWCQAAPRLRDNPALSLSISLANEQNKPLQVMMFYQKDYPMATQRTMDFFLQGALEFGQKVQGLGASFALLQNDPVSTLSDLAANGILVTDRPYLRHPRQLLHQVRKGLKAEVHICEGNLLLPVQTASPKKEYSAATLRRKITPLIPFYHQGIPLPDLLVRDNHPLLGDKAETLGRITENPSMEHLPDPAPQNRIIPGEDAALQLWENFLQDGLNSYAQGRNSPEADGQSGMSPYLHYGQISPITLTRALLDLPQDDNTERYLEELIVRRELAYNYCFYEENYDNFQGLPAWAQQALRDHQEDQRTYTYSYDELAEAKTHDKYWNAAQREMVLTGKMHGYMRMYWGKKILEWTADPAVALERVRDLNDRYSLDGRDANGYAGVAWCFGLHDRPWTRRAVFGTIRYMNDKGLKRKFNMDAYLYRVQQLEEEKA